MLSVTYLFIYLLSLTSDLDCIWKGGEINQSCQQFCSEAKKMSIQCWKMTAQHLLGSITITRNVDHEMIFSLNENVNENQTLIQLVLPYQNPNAFLDCKSKKNQFCKIFNYMYKWFIIIFMKNYNGFKLHTLFFLCHLWTVMLITSLMFIHWTFWNIVAVVQVTGESAENIWFRILKP